MPGIIESIRDRIAGVKPQVKPDKGSTAGMLKGRDEYQAYAESMMEQGKRPLTYAQWARQ
jgi:hypothetical protein